MRETVTIVGAGNIKINQEKTDQLLEEMKEQGIDVGVENLGRYIREQGLIIKVHVGGGKRIYELSSKAYGVNKEALGEEARELFQEHVKSSKISFLPNAYSKRLENLESALRMQCRRNSIGYDNSFMTIESYREFKKFYEETRKEFFEVRDEIISNYDRLVARFKEIVAISLNELNAIDKEFEYNGIVSKFGGKPGDREYEAIKKKYKEGFYMDLGIKAFPVTENLDIFTDDVRADIEKGLNMEAAQTLYEIILNALNDLYSNVSKALNSAYKSGGSVAPKTIGAVRDCIKRVRQKNIFANVAISNIVDELERILSNCTSSDEIMESFELTLVSIFKYAVDLGIEDGINLKDSPMSKDMLFDLIG